LFADICALFKATMLLNIRHSELQHILATAADAGQGMHGNLKQQGLDQQKKTAPLRSTMLL
jgi:hypothetical protein